MLDSFGQCLRQDEITVKEGMRVFRFFVCLLRVFAGSKALDMIHHHNERFRFGRVLLMSILTWQTHQQKTQ